MSRERLLKIRRDLLRQEVSEEAEVIQQITAAATEAAATETATAPTTATQGHGSSPRHHRVVERRQRAQAFRSISIEVLAKRTLDGLGWSPTAQSISESNSKLIASELSGKSVAFSKVTSMSEEMVALLNLVLGEDDLKKAYRSEIFDKMEE